MTHIRMILNHLCLDFFSKNLILMTNFAPIVVLIIFPNFDVKSVIFTPILVRGLSPKGALAIRRIFSLVDMITKP